MEENFNEDEFFKEIDQFEKQEKKDNSRTDQQNTDQPQKRNRYKKKVYPKKPRPTEPESKVDQKEKPQRPKNFKQKKVYSRNKITVIVPLLNEEESLPELILHIEEVLDAHSPNNYEVIFIDDGSTDKSWEVIKQINQRNNKCRGIRFRRNFGKSAALSVGFKEARGDVIITMDADLQDDPSEIPNLVAKLNEGFDLVSGWKKKRRDPITKTIPSRFFNFVTSTVSGVKLHDHNCGLKAYKREVCKTLNLYGEMHRYVPALASWEGFKVAELAVKHHPRRYGKTKFGLSRYMKGYLDLITVLFTTRYLKRPLHFFGTFGTLFALIGFIIDAWLTVEWFLNKTSLSNRPLALLGVAMIIVGVQFISLGLIGELIAKNSNQNVTYGIQEKIGR